VDGLTGALGSVVGTVILFGFALLVPAVQILPKAGLAIDLFLFLPLAVLARTGYEILRQAFSTLPARNGPSVVILGHGTETLALVQQLRDPMASKRATVVGILDNDELKHRCRLNGVTVLGPLSHLHQLVAANRVSACVLGVSPHSDAGRKILQFCHDAEVSVYRDLESPPLPQIDGNLVERRRR
jgi:FlaA1/EpsC-like NDP-sugar epimerase